MTDRNRTYQNGRVSTHSDIQCGSASRQTFFSEWGNFRIKLPLSGHIANKFRKPTTILQLNIEGLTASKMNVLHHLAMQSEALVILLQETHCTDVEKLVLPNDQLAGSYLSKKHGLATFFHERLRYTLLDQSPPTLEIEWRCVDVDGYKIVNVYKPPPTRLRTLDLPVFPHPCLYAGEFSCRHADWGYDDNSPLTKWSQYIALTNKFAKTLLPSDSLDLDAAYQDFCNTIKKATKKTIPHRYRNNYIPCWDAECKSLYKTFLQFSQGDDSRSVWLLQLCLPSLTKSGGIDGPKQFGALTSHTLVEKRGVL